jgi:hypothetical protein
VTGSAAGDRAGRGGAGPPYRCPVCGYPGLGDPPRADGLYPSYEICPCCGFEFGVDDDDRGISYGTWRQEWIAGGMRWRSTYRGWRWWRGDPRKPPGWDPAAQLRTVLEAGPSGAG